MLYFHHKNKINFNEVLIAALFIQERSQKGKVGH